MRQRNCRFEVCFTEEELADLRNKAQRSNLSGGDLIRRAVKDLEVKEAPSVDTLQLTVAIKRAGNNLNEVLKKENSIGLLDVPEMRKAVTEIRNVVKVILDAYTSE